MYLSSDPWVPLLRFTVVVSWWRIVGRDVARGGGKDHELFFDLENVCVVGLWLELDTACGLVGYMWGSGAGELFCRLYLAASDLITEPHYAFQRAVPMT